MTTKNAAKWLLFGGGGGSRGTRRKVIAEAMILERQFWSMSLKLTFAVAVVLGIVGAFIWMGRYRECRAHGFSMSYCATQSMTFD